MTLAMTEETLLECLMDLAPGESLTVPDQVVQRWLESRGIVIDAAWRLEFVKATPKNLIIQPEDGCLVVERSHSAFASFYRGIFRADPSRGVPVPSFMKEEELASQKTSSRTESDSDPG